MVFYIKFLNLVFMKEWELDALKSEVDSKLKLFQFSVLGQTVCLYVCVKARFVWELSALIGCFSLCT